MMDAMEVVQHKGLNPYKQYEMWAKYRPMVSVEAMEDDLYKMPDKSVIEKVVKEKGMRKQFREDMKELKEFGDAGLNKRKREDNDQAVKLIEQLAGLGNK